ncbi:MAG TPA: hypothetical protein VFB25_11785 [Gaiellaceae bacterium]|nr:hypothetical protein [Gaiellaceae bacterium]
MKAASCALLAALAAAVLAAALLPGDARPLAAARGGSAALPAAAAGAVARALAHDDARFAVRRVGGRLATAGAGVTTRYTRRGPVVDAGGVDWQLGLRRLGRAATAGRLAAVTPRGRANEVRYLHPGVVEWYANTRLGLEQGFTLSARPAGTAPLALALGDLPAGVRARISPDRRSAVLSDGGEVVLRYARLAASDARGRALRAWIEVSERRLSLRVDDRGARYPLRIDPFVEAGKLTASHGIAGDELGTAIAVSADTIAVGAPSALGGRGAVYVFVKPAGGWASATESATLTASDGTVNDSLGSSVAMSGDTIVAGAPTASVSGQAAEGAAYVFTKPGGGWTDGTESSKLTASDGAGSDQFGSSVAVDGATIAVGAEWKFRSGLFGQGAAYVFVNGVQQAKLLASDGTSDDNFGSSIAVSGDTVAVGATSARNFQGAVYVFVEPGGGWADMTQTAELRASDGGPSDHLGKSIGISGDTVAAGATAATVGAARPGAVYVFVKPQAGWSDGTQTAKLTASDGVNSDQLGWSLGIAPGTIVAGAPGAGSTPGALYVFAKPGGGWADGTESDELTASDGVAGDGLGDAAGVSDDGSVVAGGASQAAGGGAAYVFTATTTTTSGGGGAGGGNGGANGGGGGTTTTTSGGGLLPVASFAPPTVARAGAVTTLDASSSIDASKYLWDLNGDGKTDVSCDEPEVQTQFLPIASQLGGPPVARVGLTVVSQTGQTSTTTQSVSLANANVSLSSAAAGFYQRTQGAFCRTTGTTSEAVCVTKHSETWGVIEAQGCDLHEVYGLQDLPSAEDAAVIQRAIDQYNSDPAFASYDGVLCNSAHLSDCRVGPGSLAGPLESGSIQLFECRGPLAIDGLMFYPAQGHPIVISPQLNMIFWSDTEIDLNDKVLPLPPSGEFDFHDVNAPLTAAGLVYDKQSPPFAVDMPVPKNAVPGLLGLTPETATLSFTRDEHGERWVKIDTTLGLPPILKIALDANERPIVESFKQSNETGLQIGHFHVDGPKITYGSIEIDDVAVDYDNADPKPLRITGNIKFLDAKVSFAPETQPKSHADNGILFNGGSFVHAAASLDFACPWLCPPDLFPGVTLNSIGFSIDHTSAWVMGGTAQLGVIDLVDVDGGIDVAFASDDDQWTLNNKVLTQLPDFFIPHTFSTFTVAAAGNVTIDLPILKDEPIANGWVVYSAPAYMSFGASVDWSLAGIVSFDGGFSGEVNASNGRFNFTGHLQSCVVKVICGGAYGVVSSAGAGACFSVGPVNVGGGLQFPSHVYIWPLDGCKWSRFTEDHVFDDRRLAGARTLQPYVVDVPAGDPGRAIQLDGDVEAPAVRVTGPGGQDVSSSSGACTPATPTSYNGSSCLTVVGHIRIIRSPDTNETVVGLQNPAAGTYTITPQPSSTGFSHVFIAKDPAAPQITGTVVGAGATRTLRYSVNPIPDAKVTFLDVGPQGSREIGTVAGGTSGSLSFTPAPGGAAHTIQAEVEMAGLPVPLLPAAGAAPLRENSVRTTGAGGAATTTIARFDPPPLVHAGPVGRVTAKRQGTSLRVAWARVRGALRYTVAVRLRNGRVLARVAHGTSTRIGGIPRTEAGRVTVEAFANDNRAGRAGIARFAETARPYTILRPL